MFSQQNASDAAFFASFKHTARQFQIEYYSSLAAQHCFVRHKLLIAQTQFGKHVVPAVGADSGSVVLRQEQQSLASLASSTDSNAPFCA